ncbi:MAG: NAD(P)H-dependent oxidoreductase subunit E [Chloroflexota bacterium]
MTREVALSLVDPILERYKGQQDALMTMLQEIQEVYAYLPEEALEYLSRETKVPLSRIHAVGTFYHYFDVGEQRSITGDVCRGPTCSLPGIASDAGHDGPSISCPGLCDQPVAVHAGGRFSSSADGEGCFSLPMPVDTEEALFRHIRLPNQGGLEAYRSSGGYQQLLRLVQEDVAASEALEVLGASGLTGRGGAAFPLALKWRAAREAPGTPKFVICNADEGEPGTFKDRPILYLQPHLLLEAMAIAGYIVGADAGIIYLRFEYPQALEVLFRAIEEAEEAGLLGAHIGGSGFDFHAYVRRGAGAYICGEETAIMNSLEGRTPWPRERPPYPTTHGLWGKPTVINNVETLSQVPLILEKGADWFRSLGRGDNSGTKVYSVSGMVQRPGNYELPLGVTARELIFNYAGGAPAGRQVTAFTLGGISGGVVGADLLDLPLDYRSPQQHGLSLGSGGIVVLDNTCCVVDFVRSCMLFYEAESCGKCSPCRLGTKRMREILTRITEGKGGGGGCRDAL